MRLFTASSIADIYDAILLANCLFTCKAEEERESDVWQTNSAICTIVGLRECEWKIMLCIHIYIYQCLSFAFADLVKKRMVGNDVIVIHSLINFSSLINKIFCFAVISDLELSYLCNVNTTETWRQRRDRRSKIGWREVFFFSTISECNVRSRYVASNTQITVWFFHFALNVVYCTPYILRLERVWLVKMSTTYVVLSSQPFEFHSLIWMWPQFFFLRTHAYASIETPTSSHCECMIFATVETFTGTGGDILLRSSMWKPSCEGSKSTPVGTTYDTGWRSRIQEDDGTKRNVTEFQT